jgi:hypothetical protein
MLSMLAEDMISPWIDITPTNPNHPITTRIKDFLTSYASAGIAGVCQWDQDKIASYSNRYAFGAYLARNYGGAELVKNILANNSVNIFSIVAAVNTTNNKNIDFNYILEKYAEAFIFTNPSGSEASFNKTVSKPISGTTYTFTGFDIWAIKNSSNTFGPNIYSRTSNDKMEPYSIYVQGPWTTGSVSTITLKKPADDVKLFLMVK